MEAVSHHFSIADMRHSQAPIIHPAKPEGSVLELRVGQASTDWQLSVLARENTTEQKRLSHSY